jgi:hypothetical protein
MQDALAITSLIFSILAFVVSTGVLTYVLARRFSTVQVQQSTVIPQTSYEFEQPAGWRAKDEAGGPEPTLHTPTSIRLNSEEHAKYERMREQEERFEQAIADDDTSWL